MAQQFESDYIFGIHEPGGERYMLDAGRTGWLVFTEEIGHDPNVREGRDYRPYSNQGLGVIVRLNNGYYPNGTIPNSREYANFAHRCANFAANSRGCSIWIIGNEMNYRIERPPATTRAVAPQRQPTPAATPAAAPATTPSTEPPRGVVGRIWNFLQSLWSAPASTEENSSPVATPTPAAAPTRESPIRVPPDDPHLRSLPERFSALYPSTTAAPRAAAADDTEVITPTLYAQCFTLCRNAIRGVAGHAEDQVLIGAVAPWNNQTVYPGNARGDWVQYFLDILNLLGPTGLDGITLHTYTHQADPNLITSDVKMNPPFADRHFEFRAYQDFMNAIPAAMRTLPVYITETNQDVPWLDQNTLWIQRAYGEIDWWNRQAHTQKIRALVLYRWPQIDRWFIEGKGGVIEDFRTALQQEYRWRSAQPPPDTFGPNTVVATTTVVNLRQTPGYVGKPANDVVVQVPEGANLTILSTGPQQVDNLAWWQVRYAPTGQPVRTGWVAHRSPTGAELLRVVDEDSGGDVSNPFKVGDNVRTTTVVRMRRSPGHLGKPATDVITDLPANSALTVLGGPRLADGLTWWQLRVTSSGLEGWMAERSPTGEALLVLNPVVGPVDPPVTGKFKVGDRVVTLTTARLRQSPGYLNKPVTDVIADIPQGSPGVVLGGPRQADELTWWQLETTNAQSIRATGWMADAAPGGVPLLQLAESGGTSPVVSNALAPGDLVPVASTVRVRRTPGYLNKPEGDVLGDFATQTTLNLISGPQVVDSLSWWRVGSILSNGEEAVGWVAEQAPNGVTLIARPAKLAGTQIPDKAAKRYLGMPFAGSFGISQLWGENPAIYSQFTYDNVPLRGHNGIDFLTPLDTPILAVDDGVVAETVWNDPTGFGRYVKVNHSWGETIYAHLNNIQVAVGQRVARGSVLGATGNSGFSSGPHLHFAIRINPYNRADGWGGYRDPLPYFDPASVILPAYVAGGSTTRAVAPIQPPAMQVQLAEKPGYAPDQPGVRRP